MRAMINKKHGIAKILEEIIEYAEVFDTGSWDFDMVSAKSCWKALMTPCHARLTARAHHHSETPAGTGGIGNTVHMQILYHLSIQLKVLAGELVYEQFSWTGRYIVSNIHYHDRHSSILLIMANSFGNLLKSRRFNRKEVTTNAQ